MNSEKYRGYYDEDALFTRWIRNSILFLILSSGLITNNLLNAAFVALAGSIVAALSALFFFLAGPQRFTRISRVALFPLLFALVVVVAALLIDSAIQRL